jgi:hypothetical protein
MISDGGTQSLGTGEIAKKSLQFNIRGDNLISPLGSIINPSLEKFAIWKILSKHRGWKFLNP